MSIFSSSNYFFNHYIAKNIKKYGFSYIYADGALFEGFVVKGLKYKHKVLASKVELKINPLRLLSGMVSVNKMNLLGVREDTLERLLKDFQPTDSEDTELNIGVDFELRNIMLTVRPFKIEDIYVKKNSLRISYLKFIDNHLDIGKVSYDADINLGKIYFEGNFNHRVLHIEKLKVVKLNLNKLTAILKGIKSEGKEAEYHLENNPFIPKKVIVNTAEFQLMPFKIEGVESKKLLLHLKDSEFDVSNLLLKRASLEFKYDSDYLFFNTVSNYKDNLLTIEQLGLRVKKLKRVEELVQKVLSAKTTDSNKSSVKIVPIDKIKVAKGVFAIDSNIFKKEKIKSVKLVLESLLFDLTHKKIGSLKDFSLIVDTSLLYAKISGVIEREFIVDSIDFSTPSADKLIDYIASLSSDSNSCEEEEGKVALPIPHKLIIKRVKGDVENLSFEPYRVKKGTLSANALKIDLNSSQIMDGNLTIDTNSNWGRAKLEGRLRENNFYAKGFCSPNQVLLDRYSLPLKAKNLETIYVKSRFGLKDFDINATLKGKDILQTVDGISILDSKNRIKYNYHKNSLLWSIVADVTSPFLKQSKVKNTLIYKNDKLSYYGDVKSSNLALVTKPSSTLFQNIETKYRGDAKQLNIDLMSSYLKGKASIENYKKVSIVVNNRKKILLKEFINLPKSYSDLLLNSLTIELPIDFAKPMPLKGSLKVFTNIGTLSHNWMYDKSTFSTDGKLLVTPNSLLFKKYPQLNRKSIKEFKSQLHLKNDTLNLSLKNQLLDFNILYNIKQELFKNLTLKLDKVKANASGSVDNIDINIQTTSLKSLQRSLAKLYKFKVNDKIDGKLEFNGKLKKLSALEFTVITPKIIYKDKKSQTDISDIFLNGTISGNTLTLKKYNALVKGYKVYSNRVATINIKDLNNIKVETLWINDTLKVNGNYNSKENRGKFLFKSNSFKIENSDILLNLALDTKVILNRERVAATGTIIVLDGFIKKVLGAKNIAENSDIIILQRQKSRESTKFAKNIKLNIKIKSKKGILYKHGGNKIRILPNLTIRKEYNQLSRFNGKATIAKNSYYYLNGKKLVVEKGNIIFKGKSMSPNLDIVLKYRGREYTIDINIVGTPTHPVLYFSSEPALNKDQILAYLLFDDASAAGTHDQAAMLNTIGGSIAKSFLGSLGIKVDHFSIKENGFSIGKSLGKHVIIYYNQENQEPSIKTRVDISKSVHTDVEIGKEKQSVDIVFSQDY